MRDQQHFNASEADAAFVRTGSADAWTVAQFRRDLSDWLRSRFTFDSERLNDVLLAANEALTNAAEFAYVGRRVGSGTMAVEARYDTLDHTLHVDVSDLGTWHPRDPGTVPNTRGRGIPLMHALADYATISPLPTGTRVQLQFNDCARLGKERCATPA